MAAITLLIIYRKDWRPASLSQIKPQQWLSQLILAIASGALAPALMFTALSKTSVINIALIETIQIPLVLFFAWLFFRQSSNLQSITGAVIALAGVVLTLYLQQSSSDTLMQMGNKPGGNGIGELLAIIAVVIFVLASVFSKRLLQTVPLDIFSVFRNFIGTLIFIIIVMVLFGPDHFIDLFSPVLWGWMLLYGGKFLPLGARDKAKPFTGI